MLAVVQDPGAVHTGRFAAYRSVWKTREVWRERELNSGPRQHFSKVLHVVALYSRDTRVLTFEKDYLLKATFEGRITSTHTSTNSQKSATEHVSCSQSLIAHCNGALFRPSQDGITSTRTDNSSHSNVLHSSAFDMHVSSSSKSLAAEHSPHARKFNGQRKMLGTIIPQKSATLHISYPKPPGRRTFE